MKKKRKRKKKKKKKKTKQKEEIWADAGNFKDKTRSELKELISWRPN